MCFLAIYSFFKVLLFLIINTSRNAIFPFSSISYVNSIFLWKLLKTVSTLMSYWWASLIIEMVSSTYLFQGLICSVNLEINVCSRCTMNIPASTGPKSEPITILSLLLHQGLTHCWPIASHHYIATPFSYSFRIYLNLKSSTKVKL